MDLSRFPRRHYTPGPTPLQPLPRLSKELGATIYIKRDDLLGLTAGGNKTRKLEFLMAEALASGATDIITTGAVQSNHCRLTLAAAVTEGCAAHLLLHERVPGTYSPEAGGNNLLYRLLGAATIEVAPATADLGARMAEMAEELRAAGRTPYIIPGGGSVALGALGYAAAAQEILAQSFAAGLPIDHIVTPSVSGGTHAGLVAGSIGLGASWTITGISADEPAADQEAKVLQLARDAAVLAGIDREIPESAVTVREEFIGPGYSLPSPAMTEAVQLFARTEGILLDPVYSGKAASGLIAMARAGEFDGGTALFLHTGGSPATYHYRSQVLPS
ncbi:MAG: D-cysteine desulfhydrase [Flaviflexus sp.]|nr:D-cysteine desulfhydrase [Flaviflexus sp.]